MTYKRKQYEFVFTNGYAQVRTWSCVIESHSKQRAMRKFLKYYGKQYVILSIRTLPGK